MRIYCSLGAKGFDITEGNILHFGKEVDAIDDDESDAVGVGVGDYEIVYSKQRHLKRYKLLMSDVTVSSLFDSEDIFMSCPDPSEEECSLSRFNLVHDSSHDDSNLMQVDQLHVEDGANLVRYFEKLVRDEVSACNSAHDLSEPKLLQTD